MSKTDIVIASINNSKPLTKQVANYYDYFTDRPEECMLATSVANALHRYFSERTKLNVDHPTLHLLMTETLREVNWREVAEACKPVKK